MNDPAGGNDAASSFRSKRTAITAPRIAAPATTGAGGADDASHEDVTHVSGRQFRLSPGSVMIARSSKLTDPYSSSTPGSGNGTVYRVASGSSIFSGRGPNNLLRCSGSGGMRELVLPGSNTPRVYPCRSPPPFGRGQLSVAWHLPGSSGCFVHDTPTPTTLGAGETSALSVHGPGPPAVQRRSSKV